MFDDMDLSKETMDTFKVKNANSAVVAGVQFKGTILTGGFWPEQANYPLRLSTTLKNVSIIFEKFYKDKYGGRHLNWIHRIGKTAIQPTFTERPYEFDISTYQACILMLFNDAEEMTIKEIMDATNLPLTEVQFQMKNLFSPKTKILQKQNAKTPKITESEKV